MHYFERALMFTIVNNKTGMLSQVDDSGHRILQEKCGKVSGSCRNRPKIIGKNPKIFRPEYCFHEIIGIPGNPPFPGRAV
jgi:hypothetical protein